MEEPSIKYILLCDRLGRVVEKDSFLFALSLECTPIQVLRGEILEGVPKADQPTDFTKVAVVGIKRKSLRLEFRMEDVTRLSEEESNLLLAITSPEGRYQMYTDRKRLMFGRQLSPGSAVFVEVKGASKVLPGIVRYNGVLPPSLGTWFGVELIKHPGSGTCNGTFRNKRYFVCEPDSGVFVGLDKLRPREDGDDLKSSKIAKKDEDIQAKLKSSLKDSISSFWKAKCEQRSFGGIDGVLKIDDRVVTFIKDSPARGTVRHIGEETNSTGNVYIIVGLELDERVGSGCGKRCGSQKFICKRGYAEFVPLKTVILENDFDGNPGKAAGQEARGKKKQIREDEMYTRSMSCVNVPSGKQRQSRDMGGQLPSLQEKPRENDEEKKSLLVRLREMEQQVTQLRAQLEEKESEKQEQGDRLQRQLRGMEQRLADEHERLQEKDDQLVNSEAQVKKMEEQLTNAQGQLQEKHDQFMNSEEQVKKMEEQLTNAQGQLQEKHDQLVNSEAQVREATQQLTNIQEQLQGKDEEIAGLRNQVTELEMSLSTAQQLALNARQRQESPDWVISRNQIQVTDKCLGRGGWGIVVEGKYCGCAVAVKKTHDLILSNHNRSLFEREMNIASRCRHPCLLQFVGATNDEGSPLFVTELMETSLRALLKRPLSATELFVISLDVARALNYLHQRQPSPIIHRDISSANVLLWRQGDQWRAKVSDYGTANFMQHTMTVAPGAPIYSAPEAVTKNQTVKVDVYSFGVLLCEMSIQEMPDPKKREQQVALVKNRVIRALIRRCLQTEPEARPCMEEIIDELEQPT